MKRILFLLIIIVLGGVVLMIPYLWPSPPDDPLPDPTTQVQALRDSIRSLSESDWDLQKYETLKSRIDARSSAGLISDQAENDLLHNLNLNYLPVLVDETYEFYRGECEDRDKLSVLNNELKRYVGDEKYGKAVKELRDASEAIYAVAGWDHEQYPYKSERELGREGNLHGLIYKYTKRNERDPSYESSLFNKIRVKAQNSLASKCYLFQGGMRENMKRLDDFAYDQIEEKVNNYVADTNNFSRLRHKEMIQEIDQYSDLAYDWSEAARKERVAQLGRKLDDYYRQNRKEWQ